MANTEMAIASADRAGREALYAADAAGQAVIAELAPMGSWSGALTVDTSTLLHDAVLVAQIPGQIPSTSPRGRRRFRRMPTPSSQAPIEANGICSPGARHRWCFRLLHPSAPSTLRCGWLTILAYGDGNPSADANGIVIVHAESYGAGGLLRAVECVVSRAPTMGSRPVLLSWRELRPI